MVLQYASVAQRDADIRLEIAFHSPVDRRMHAIADGYHVWIANHVVGVLGLMGTAIEQSDCSGVIHAEFSFETGAGCFLAGQLEHHGIDSQLDALDVCRFDGVHALQLYAAVDHGVHDQPARIGLVHVAGELEVLAQTFGDDGRVEAAREHVSPAARRFDAALRAVEIPGREQCCAKPVACGRARMKALAHRAEHLAQTRRLRGCDAERPRHLLHAQTQQLSGCGGCAEHTGRAGDVPADVVVLGKDRKREAALDFHTEDEGMKKVCAGDIAPLAEREESRIYRRAGMNRLLVRVVEVQHVRADAVQECGVEDVEALATSEQGGLWRAREGLERGECASYRFVMRGADRAAQPV